MTGSQDGAMMTWDTKTGEGAIHGAAPMFDSQHQPTALPEGVQPGHDDWIQGLIVSDAGIAVTCGWDDLVIVWS